MIVIDGHHLTTAEIDAVANRRAEVGVSQQARRQATDSYEFARRAASERPIYGRSTGVGANRTVLIAADPSSVEKTAAALLRSHATSAGPLRAWERVRAMLVVRLNQLAAGGSGADPEVLDALAAMISSDALPPVREQGSIGTGDLSALAVTALALRGEIATTSPLPAQAKLHLVDALGFMSSNAATIADAALGLVELRTLAEAAVVTAALSFTAVQGNAEAFAEAVEEVTPFDGARWVCQAMRAMVPADGRPPARIQDPFGLRALPQVHGALLDALATLERTVVLLANAASENPVLSPEFGVAHHGGFHAAYLAQALDAVALAIAQSAQLSLARLTMLNEPALTGLSAFLGDGTPGASGLMIVEYNSASALAGLRALAMPASLQTVTLSRGVEEDASFASLAARQALDAVGLYRTVLAGELVAAIRAVRLHDLPSQLTGPLQRVFARAAVLDVAVEDRDLTADIAIAEGMLDDLAEVLAQTMSLSGDSSSA
jgi:histidine ammonia-lyase